MQRNIFDQLGMTNTGFDLGRYLYDKVLFFFAREGAGVMGGVKRCCTWSLFRTDYIQATVKWRCTIPRITCGVLEPPLQTLFLNYTADLIVKFGFLEKALLCLLEIIISVMYVFQNVL